MNTLISRIKMAIPNTLTLMNLLCGMFALSFAFTLNFEMVFWAVIAAAGFDFLDGFAARGLKAYSTIGADLDSLADMVSFGAVPGVVIFQFLSVSAGFGETMTVACVGFLVTLFSALRLAKFNNDSRQGEEFRGLAVPASALLVVSLGAAYIHQMSADTWMQVMIEPWFLVALTVILCFLLVCDLPMFSLKFKNFSVRDNALRYGFLLFSLAVILLAGWLALAIIVCSYVVLSVVLWMTSRCAKSKNNAM